MRTASLSLSRLASTALVGTLAVLRLLPLVSPTRTIFLVFNTLVTASLPIAVTVITGRLIGLVPDVVRTGFSSPAGRQLVVLLVVAASLIIVLRALGPLQLALAGTFARQIDRFLQERVMAAVGQPRTIGHLEDPVTLDLIRNTQGVGRAAYGQAGAARRADYLRDLALRPSAAKELRVWGMLDWLLGQYDATWIDAMGPIWEARKPGRPILWVATGVVVAVQAALVGAGAEEIPTSLPAGLETQLGRSWNGGVELSGGQWQKLSLARAMMRPSPLLVVFDEPTGALDAPTEHALFERVAAAARRGDSAGTVTLLVTHRFSTVRMADLIVVLSGGRIVEVGSHGELIAARGLYAELYELQARTYR